MVLCIFIAVHEQSESNAFRDAAQKIASSLEQGSSRCMPDTPSICFELFNATVLFK